MSFRSEVVAYLSRFGVRICSQVEEQLWFWECGNNPKLPPAQVALKIKDHMARRSYDISEDDSFAHDWTHLAARSATYEARPL